MKLPRGIKRESASLLTKCLNSLTLAIEIFNRPSDMGRIDTVLILMDHSFEMLLKASIIQRGGRIIDPGMNCTIGFQTCISRARSNADVHFISEEEAILPISINALRDADQHYLADVTEEILYLHVQSGVTLVRTIVSRVFGIDISDYLPRRVLPISTIALTGIEALFDEKVSEIKRLLSPGRRQGRAAISALRPLAIMDRAIKGEEGQPSDRELREIAKRLKRGDDWRVIFLGANLIECVAEGAGEVPPEN